MVVEGWLIAFLLAQPPAARNYQKAAELFAKHDLQGAEAAVEESLHLDPQYVPALVLKARLAMISRRMEVARRALEAAVAAGPDQSGYLRFNPGSVAALAALGAIR
jgi:Tfp pilus assembly protein PilF